MDTDPQLAEARHGFEVAALELLELRRSLGPGQPFSSDPSLAAILSQARNTLEGSEVQEAYAQIAQLESEIERLNLDLRRARAHGDPKVHMLETSKLEDELIAREDRITQLSASLEAMTAENNDLRLNLDGHRQTWLDETAGLKGRCNEFAHIVQESLTRIGQLSERLREEQTLKSLAAADAEASKKAYEASSAKVAELTRLLDEAQKDNLSRVQELSAQLELARGEKTRQENEYRVRVSQITAQAEAQSKQFAAQAEIQAKQFANQAQQIASNVDAKLAMFAPEGDAMGAEALAFMPSLEPMLETTWGKALDMIRRCLAATYAHLRKLSASPLAANQRTLLKLSAASLAQASDAVTTVGQFLEEGGPEPTVNRLDPAVASVMSVWGQACRTRGISLSRSGEGDMGQSVLFHPESLRIALYQIMRNAFEAMPKGGSLSVRVWRDSNLGFACVSFADTGRGFSKEALSRLFTPFATSKPGHMGLGLALARRILNRWGGDIEAANNSQTGATVTLRLAMGKGEAPALQSEAALPAGPTQPPAPPAR
ncbi:MAG: ATP-binding protein [Elusimicrobiota bacterium]|jgi:signal transduction histidine kinase